MQETTHTSMYIVEIITLLAVEGRLGIFQKNQE